MGIDPEKWLWIVRDLAEQNAAVRVCLSSTPMDEGGVCARVRVLQVGEDNQTVVEEPDFGVLGQRLEDGTGVEVLAVNDGQRLLAQCRVTGRLRFALNESTRINAIRLSAPTRVSSGQLRDYYRAPVGAGVDVGPVLLSLDQNDEPTIARALEAGIDPQAVHKARLVNISGGGAGLAMVVDRALVPVFPIGTACCLSADLPTFDEPLDLQAQVVHAHKLENSDLYLGLAFIFDDPILQKQIENQLQRLSVWLQRRMLKNER